VVPPIGLAEIRFQVIGGPCDDDDGRRDQRPYAEKNAERQDDDAEPLQQARIRYFHGLCRLHSEDHGYPENIASLFIRTRSFRPWTVDQPLGLIKPADFYDSLRKEFMNQCLMDKKNKYVVNWICNLWTFNGFVILPIR